MLNTDISYPKIELSKQGAAIYLSLHTGIHEVNGEEAAQLHNELTELMQKIDAVPFAVPTPEYQTWKRQAQGFAREVLRTLEYHRIVNN